jgi:excisionase family DNA binding protein
MDDVENAVEQTEQRYFSLKDVARYVGVSAKFIARRVASGTLRSYLVGGRRLFRLQDVDAMIARCADRRPRRGRGRTSRQARLAAANEDATNNGTVLPTAVG